MHPTLLFPSQALPPSQALRLATAPLSLGRPSPMRRGRSPPTTRPSGLRRCSPASCRRTPPSWRRAAGSCSITRVRAHVCSVCAVHAQPKPALPHPAQPRPPLPTPLSPASPGERQTFFVEYFAMYSSWLLLLGVPGLFVSVAVGVYAHLADAQSSDALYESLTIVWSFFTLVWAFALRKAWQRRESMLGSGCRSWPPTVISSLASRAPKAPAVAVCGAEGTRCGRPSAPRALAFGQPLATLPSPYTQARLPLVRARQHGPGGGGAASLQGHPCHRRGHGRVHRVVVADGAPPQVP